MKRRPLSVMVASLIVSTFARLVPPRFRARWIEEWRGEIGTAAPGASLVVRALGASRDAVACRRLAADSRAAERVSFSGEGILSDVWFAVRMVRRAPAFTFAAVASLSIGIAATTTAFSAINALLFRSMPGIVDSTRLAQIFTMQSGAAGPSSDAHYRRYRETFTAFSDITAAGAMTVAIGQGDEPFIARATLAAENYFAVLGTTPAAGRLIDASISHEPVAVVSHEFARRHFGEPPAAIGRTVLVNGHALQIVGVAPPWFGGANPGDFGGDPASRPQLWVPLALRDTLAAPRASRMNRVLPRDGGRSLALIGRLAPGVTLDEARAQAGAVAADAPGPARREGRPVIVPLGRGPNDSDSDIATAVALVLSIPLIVLAIGCANTANLQLARAAHRQAEIAVRRSLGASRGRVVRQLLMESAAVAALAGIIGLAATMVLTRILAGFMPVPFPVDWRVLAFALVVVTLTGLGFGMAPALGATRGDLSEPLKDSSGAPVYRRSRLRNGLVIAQIALSLLLLVMAGLFTRTLQRLHGLDAERDLAHVAAATIDLGYMKYSEEQGRAFQAELLDRLERHPGVAAAAIVPFEPFGGSTGLTYRVPGERDTLPYRYANGGAARGRFVEAAGIRVLQGRAFTDADRAGSPRVALVSRSLAARIAPSGDVLGRQILVGDGLLQSVDVTIVGVTADATFRIGGRDMNAMFLPSPLNYDDSFCLWVRTTGDAAGIVPEIRRLLRELDPRLPVKAGTAESWRYRAVGPVRWIASGLGAMGALALALAAAGLYAVMAYLVARRRHEMAIRLALGATPGHLTALVLRDGVRLALPGLAIGALVSALAARLVRALLVGVSPFDPVAFGTVAALLVVVAIAATLLPAMRASRLDPLATLRRQ